MEPEVSLPRSQESSTGPYSHPDTESTHSKNCIKVNLKLISRIGGYRRVGKNHRVS
jgi:hypothetical protein